MVKLAWCRTVADHCRQFAEGLDEAGPHRPARTASSRRCVPPPRCRSALWPSMTRASDRQVLQWPRPQARVVRRIDAPAPCLRCRLRRRPSSRSLGFGDHGGRLWPPPWSQLRERGGATFRLRRPPRGRPPPERGRACDAARPPGRRRAPAAQPMRVSVPRANSSPPTSDTGLPPETMVKCGRGDEHGRERIVAHDQHLDGELQRRDDQDQPQPLRVQGQNQPRQHQSDPRADHPFERRVARCGPSQTPGAGPTRRRTSPSTHARRPGPKRRIPRARPRSRHGRRRTESAIQG